MSEQLPDDLVHAAFFFVDIVGLSNPIVSTETQRTKIKVLNEAIYDCKTFTLTPKEELFVLPTGDGMLVGFKDGLEEPLKLAIELHEKLKAYNQKALSTEKIATRIGCNIGHIFVVKDVFDNMNLWGPGAILARRVMDLGDENHILITSNMANDLFEISDDYKNVIHPIHDYKIKHNEEILVYSAYNENFGNKTPPKKTVTTSKINSDAKTVCHKIIFNIKIKDFMKTVHTEHERIYDFVNNSTTPIYEIYVGIMTNTESEVSDLHIRALDEDDNELEITKIASTSPFSKTLTVKLKRPVFRGGEGRQVRIYYEKSEVAKHFEHQFFTDTKKFELNFILPYNFPQRNPKLFLIDEENHKKLIYQSDRKSKGLSRIIQWKHDKQINLNERIRLEWHDDLS